MDKNNKKCASIREFFDYMIESGKLLEGQKIYDEKTRTKFINGRVRVDGKKTAANLDWSRITAQQFTFINDSEPLITNYSKLPVTSDGISGDLPMPANITEFLAHNAFGNFKVEKERIVVTKNLTIPKMKDMDLSKVEVEGSVLWHGGNIKISQLPKVRGNIYCMTRENLIVDKEEKISSENLKKRHIQFSILVGEKPKNRLKQLINRCFNGA